MYTIWGATRRGSQGASRRRLAADPSRFASVSAWSQVGGAGPPHNQCITPPQFLYIIFVIILHSIFQIELRFYRLWRCVLRYQKNTDIRASYSMKTKSNRGVILRAVPREHGHTGALVKTSLVSRALARGGRGQDQMLDWLDCPPAV